MTRIQGFPHDLLENGDNWLPRFSGNNDVLAKKNSISFYDTLSLRNAQYEHQDVVMRLFSSSLIKDSKLWYDDLPSKNIKTWQTLEDVFLKK